VRACFCGVGGGGGGDGRGGKMCVPAVGEGIPVGGGCWWAKRSCIGHQSRVLTALHDSCWSTSTLLLPRFGAAALGDCYTAWTHCPVAHAAAANWVGWQLPVGGVPQHLGFAGRLVVCVVEAGARCSTRGWWPILQQPEGQQQLWACKSSEWTTCDTPCCSRIVSQADQHLHAAAAGGVCAPARPAMNCCRCS
jgi:hypothetical protein